MHFNDICQLPIQKKKMQVKSNILKQILRINISSLNWMALDHQICKYNRWETLLWLTSNYTAK
jgi:hypothetical protein